MKIKIFLFFIGVLILAQMLIYMQIRDANEENWRTAFHEIDNRITNQKNEIISTQQVVRVMEKGKKSIPETILKGVEDPEGKFLMFMDYLDKSELGNMSGSYDISAEPLIKNTPVPLQQTDFHLQFQFEDVTKLEMVLSYLLDQKGEKTGYPDYPLKVNRLKIERVPGSKPKVDLDVSLLLPAQIEDSDTNQHIGSGSIGG